MMEKRSQEEIEEWAKKLVLSHGGSISGKTIRGTVRHYLQWPLRTRSPARHPGMGADSSISTMKLSPLQGVRQASARSMTPLSVRRR